MICCIWFEAFFLQIEPGHLNLISSLWRLRRMIVQHASLILINTVLILMLPWLSILFRVQSWTLPIVVQNKVCARFRFKSKVFFLIMSVSYQYLKKFIYKIILFYEKLFVQARLSSWNLTEFVFISSSLEKKYAF